MKEFLMLGYTLRRLENAKTAADLDYNHVSAFLRFGLFQCNRENQL